MLCAMSNKLFLQDSLVEQSTQGSFVPQGCQDILTTTLGTEEHPGRVRTAGYGVGVRQYFGSYQCQNTTQIGPITPEMIEHLTQTIKAQVAEELRHEFDQRWESMSQQHNVVQEDDEEEVTEMNISNRCKLYVGEVMKD